MSHDGALVAVWGPELTLLSTADGSVRASFAGCATSATFAPKDDALLVVGCPKKDDDGDGYRPGAGPDTEVFSWTLATDEVRSITRGPYTHVRLTLDETAAILTGRDSAVVWSIADGAARATFALPGARAIDVATAGDRAIASNEKASVLLAPNAEPAPIVMGSTDARSPDLRLVARTQSQRLVVNRVDDGKLVFEARLDRPNVLAFDHRSEHIAVSFSEGDARKLAVLDRGGKRQCATKGAALKPRSVVWSSDATRLAVLSDLDHGEKRWAILDAKTCEPVAVGAPMSVSSDDFAWNGALRGAIGYGERNDWFGVPKLALFGAAKDEPWTVLDRPAPPRLSVVRGVDVAVCDEAHCFAFHPSTETISAAARELPVTSSAGTLSATTTEGNVVDVHSPLRWGPPEEPSFHLSGELFLLGPKGEKTVLEQSAPFTAPSPISTALGALMYCGASASKRFVWCSRAEPQIGQSISIWDAKGHRVLDRGGTLATIGDDDRHALITWFDIGGTVLVDLQTGKELAKSAAPLDMAASLSPDGKFVAWDSRGIVDAATGETLFSDMHGFGPWFSTGDRLFVHRAEARDRHLRETAFGPMDVRVAGTNAVLGTLDDDAEVLQLSADEARFVTRNGVDVVRVRDATTFKILSEAVGYDRVRLSEDGAFLFLQGAGALLVRRLADGAELLQVPPSTPGERGLSFTRSGLYDGGDAALGALQYREGDVRTGKLVPAIVERPGDRRPGLAADFFAGKPITERP